MPHGQYASGLAQADVAPVDEGPGGRACCRFLCPMHGENDGRSSRCSGCRRGNRGISVQGSRSNPFVAGIRGIVSLSPRIPAWCDDPVITLNGRELPFQVQSGYARIVQNWQNGDRLDIHLPMEVKTVTRSMYATSIEKRAAGVCAP